jgi:hypothetical protein
MKTFNEYMIDESVGFVVLSRVNGDMWKINKVFADKKEADSAKKSIWVKSGKMSDKAIVPLSVAKRNKWKPNGIVTWNGRGAV